MSAQAYPQALTGTTAPVSASTSVVNIELVTPSYNAAQAASSGIAQRQVMCLGDPDNGNLIADVVNHPCTGIEAALAVTLAPGSPDLRTIQELLMNILLEMRSLNANLNSIPTDATSLGV